MRWHLPSQWRLSYDLLAIHELVTGQKTGLLQVFYEEDGQQKQIQFNLDTSNVAVGMTFQNYWASQITGAGLENILAFKSGVSISFNGASFRYKGSLLECGWPKVLKSGNATGQSVSNRSFLGAESVLLPGKTVETGKNVSGKNITHSMLSLVLDTEKKVIYGPYFPKTVFEYKVNGSVAGYCASIDGSAIPESTAITSRSLSESVFGEVCSSRYYVQMDGEIKPLMLGQRFGKFGGLTNCVSASTYRWLLLMACGLEDARLSTKGSKNPIVSWVRDESEARSGWVSYASQNDTYTFILHPEQNPHVDHFVNYVLPSSVLLKLEGLSRNLRAETSLSGYCSALKFYPPHLKTGAGLGSMGYLTYETLSSENTWVASLVYSYDTQDSRPMSVAGSCSLLSDAFIAAYALRKEGCLVDIVALHVYCLLVMMRSNLLTPAGYADGTVDQHGGLIVKQLTREQLDRLSIDGLDGVIWSYPAADRAVGGDSYPSVVFDIPYDGDRDRRFAIQRITSSDSHMQGVVRCYGALWDNSQGDDAATKGRKARGEQRLRSVHAWVEQDDYILYDPLLKATTKVSKSSYGNMFQHHNGVAIGEFFPYQYRPGEDGATVTHHHFRVVCGKKTGDTLILDPKWGAICQVTDDAFHFQEAT